MRSGNGIFQHTYHDNTPCIHRRRPLLTLRHFAKKNKLRYSQLVQRLERGDTTSDERGVFIRVAQGDIDPNEEDEVPPYFYICASTHVCVCVARRKGHRNLLLVLLHSPLQLLLHRPLQLLLHSPLLLLVLLLLVLPLLMQQLSLGIVPSPPLLLLLTATRAPSWVLQTVRNIPV